MKRLHYCQHVSFEGLGSIAIWAEAAGFQISGPRLYRNDPLPDVDNLEWLVIMGGPMTIYEEAVHPWLRDEKKVIHQAIAGARPFSASVLGPNLSQTF
jgi:GMP synthase (glutamine-hydrolysing)